MTTSVSVVVYGVAGPLVVLVRVQGQLVTVRVVAYIYALDDDFLSVLSDEY